MIRGNAEIEVGTHNLSKSPLAKTTQKRILTFARLSPIRLATADAEVEVRFKSELPEAADCTNLVRAAGEAA